MEVRTDGREKFSKAARICMDVKERQGTYSCELKAARLELLNGGIRQARENGADEWCLRQKGGEDSAVPEDGGEAGCSVFRLYLLKEDEMRSVFSDDGAQAAQV